MNSRLGKYEMAEIARKFSDIGCVLTLSAMEYVLGQKNPTVFAEEIIRKLKEKSVYGRVLRKDDLINGKVKEKGEIFEEKAQEEVKEVELHDMEEVLEGIPEEPVEEIAELEYLFEEKVQAEEKEEELEEKEEKYKISPIKRPEREEIEIPVEILEPKEEELYSKGDMNSFLEYFRDRYRRIRGMIVEKVKRIPERPRIVSIEEIWRHREEEVILIGIVTEVRSYSNFFSLKVQDETGFFTVKVPKDRENLFFLVGEVLGFRGIPNGKALRVKDSKRGIILPHFPIRRRKLEREIPDVKIAITSDIHVGSKNFMKEEFKRFVDWINKSEEASKVKYLIIPGDLVDGVGIYPNQEKELEEVDVYAQYEELFEYLSEIDESIHIFLIPGNHDLVRQSLPQPKISIPQAKNLGDNIHLLQNPTFLRFFNTLGILLLHGRPLEDLFSKVPGAKHERPTEVMKVLLDRRHLSPVYGEKTPIQPLPRDYLVIDDDRIPDVFVTGHVHTFDVSFYKRVCLINASAWQSQTEYQRTRGIVPNPAKVVLIDVRKFYGIGGGDPIEEKDFLR